MTLTITEHHIATPDGARRYLAARPHGVAGQLPAILLLHGHGASASFMLGQSKLFGFRDGSWHALAEREGILLLAPDGSLASDAKQAWNDCRADAPTNATTDDVGFLDALLDAAVAVHGADPQRIYVFGSSNGGAMAYRLACERGERLAAIGVQSALMAALSCCPPPLHPLPVYLVHGTADKIAPYAGGAVGGWGAEGRGSTLDVDASLAIWRALAGLQGEPAVHYFARRDPADQTAAVRYTWGDDPAGPQVALLRVEGGGHTAPSLEQQSAWLWRRFVGATNHDVEWADELWSFFRAKRAPL
ncbi:MAG: alpha/beta hydrolase family esterase [Telluria sp.]